MVMNEGYRPTSRQKGPLLVWGSILRIVGALIAGFDLVWLGLWISNLYAISSSNPAAPFQTLGTMVVVAGVAGILAGVGWSLQNWSRGL
jgi:hypothetical protein